MISGLFTTDSTPDEQPQPISEVNERRENAAAEVNEMEVNCNGHASTPECEGSPEAPGTKQSTEEQEDQQNANQPESNTDSQQDTLSNKEEHQTCNGSSGDPDTDPQQLPDSLSPDSVTVEVKEEDKEEKKEEEMDTHGETKRGRDEEEDSQDGLLNLSLSFCYHLYDDTVCIYTLRESPGFRTLMKPYEACFHIANFKIKPFKKILNVSYVNSDQN